MCARPPRKMVSERNERGLSCLKRFETRLWQSRLCHTHEPSFDGCLNDVPSIVHASRSEDFFSSSSREGKESRSNGVIETVHFRPFSLSFAVFFFCSGGKIWSFPRVFPAFQAFHSVNHQVFMCGGAGTKLACSSLPLPSPSYLKLHFYATSLDWFPEKPLSPTVQPEFQGVRPSSLIAILPV